MKFSELKVSDHFTSDKVPGAEFVKTSDAVPRADEYSKALVAAMAGRDFEDPTFNAEWFKCPFPNIRASIERRGHAKCVFSPNDVLREVPHAVQ